MALFRKFEKIIIHHGICRTTYQKDLNKKASPFIPTCFLPPMDHGTFDDLGLVKHDNFIF